MGRSRLGWVAVVGALAAGLAGGLVLAQPRPRRVVAPPPPVPASEWRQCASDGDCALAATSCCGTCGTQPVDSLRAIATRRAELWHRRVCPGWPVPCPACAVEMPDGVSAACVSRRCELVVAEAAAAPDAGPPDAGAPDAGVPGAGACTAAQPRVVRGRRPLPPADRRCRADADCAVTAAPCCAPCGVLGPRDARAVSTARAAAVHARGCAGVGCPRCTSSVAPDLSAACVRRQCELVVRDTRCERR